MEHKIVNDAVAYIQSLAQLRGRNAQWAEQAVREGRQPVGRRMPCSSVIDLMAVSVDELLAQLNGREVEVGASSGRWRWRVLPCTSTRWTGAASSWR